MKKRQSPLFALWLLLVVAMAIFIGISFAGDINFMGHTLIKARFPETLLAPKEEVYKEIPEEPSDTLPVLSETTSEPDTTVHSVLVFGDSMTHNLAMSIAKYGTKNGYKVWGVTWESSSIPAWHNSGKIEEYVEMSKPDFVIISLGSNEMGLKYFDRRIPDMKQVVKKLGDLPYVWVGPPLWSDDKGLYRALEEALPKDRIFKISKEVEIERGPDHVHPTRRGADQWADTLMRWISGSSHPILAERPDSGTGTKGHRFIYLHPDD